MRMTGLGGKERFQEMKRDLGQEAGLMEEKARNRTSHPWIPSHCLPRTPHFPGLYQYCGRGVLPPGPHWNLWELVPEPGVPHFLLLLYDPEVWDLAGNSIPVSLEEASQHLSAMLWGWLSPQSWGSPDCLLSIQFQVSKAWVSQLGDSRWASRPLPPTQLLSVEPNTTDRHSPLPSRSPPLWGFVSPSPSRLDPHCPLQSALTPLFLVRHILFHTT